MSRKIIAEWLPPVNFPHVSLDSIYPGGLFSRPIIDDIVEYYEVDRFEPDEGEFMSIGTPRSARIEFPAEDYENATIRIRAVLNNGSKTAFIFSTMLVYSMVAEFKSPNNTILLSFI